MQSSVKVASLVLVGAFWGCSNPFLRKGSEAAIENAQLNNPELTGIQFLIQQLSKFQYTSVWLPYALNQCGSLLFYVTLSKNDLSLAVPACNALALVFSIITSWWILNEPVKRPTRTAVGATFVVAGVALCVHASTAAASHDRREDLI
jgi:Putative transmembrane family 234